jgi:hypothetical protein
MDNSRNQENHPVLKFSKDQIESLEDGSIRISSTLMTYEHMTVSIDSIDAYRHNMHFKLSVTPEAAGLIF